MGTKGRRHLCGRGLNVHALVAPYFVPKYVLAQACTSTCPGLCVCVLVSTRRTRPYEPHARTSFLDLYDSNELVQGQACTGFSLLAYVLGRRVRTDRLSISATKQGHSEIVATTYVLSLSD